VLANLFTHHSRDDGRTSGQPGSLIRWRFFGTKDPFSTTLGHWATGPRSTRLRLGLCFSRSLTHLNSTHLPVYNPTLVDHPPPTNTTNTRRPSTKKKNTPYPPANLDLAETPLCTELWIECPLSSPLGSTSFGPFVSSSATGATQRTSPHLPLVLGTLPPFSILAGPGHKP